MAAPAQQRGATAPDMAFEVTVAFDPDRVSADRMFDLLMSGPIDRLVEQGQDNIYFQTLIDQTDEKGRITHRRVKIMLKPTYFPVIQDAIRWWLGDSYDPHLVVDISRDYATRTYRNTIRIPIYPKYNGTSVIVMGERDFCVRVENRVVGVVESTSWWQTVGNAFKLDPYVQSLLKNDKFAARVKESVREEFTRGAGLVQEHYADVAQKDQK